MKQILTLIWLCSLAVNSLGQSSNDAKLQITIVLNKQAAAWNEGDINAYMLGYWNNDSLLFIGSKGPVYGYKPTLERYRKSYPDKRAMGELSFSNLAFKRLSNEYYYVVGKWSLLRENDNPNGYFTLLFRRIEGKWLIVADHSS